MCGACRPPSPSGTRPGLRVKIAELPGGLRRRRAGVAAEARVGRRSAGVLRRREAAVRVGLPGLDHRVGDDVAGAVEHPAADPDAALGALARRPRCRPARSARSPGRARPWRSAWGPSRNGSVRKPVPRCPERGWCGPVASGTSSGFTLTRHLRRPRSRTGSGRVPRSTMSHSKASAQLSWVRSREYRLIARCRAARRDGVEDRVLTEQRVVREVHLGDQPLGEGPAEQAEVDVRRPPGVVVVAPRVGAGLDRHELVAAQAVGDHPAQPVEVRVQGSPGTCRRRAGSGRRRWPATPRPARRAPGGRRCRAPARRRGSAGPPPRRRCAASGRRPRASRGPRRAPGR